MPTRGSVGSWQPARAAKRSGTRRYARNVMGRDMTASGGGKGEAPVQRGSEGRMLVPGRSVTPAFRANSLITGRSLRSALGGRAGPVHSALAPRAKAPATQHSEQGVDDDRRQVVISVADDERPRPIGEERPSGVVRGVAHREHRIYRQPSHTPRVHRVNR